MVEELAGRGPVAVRLILFANVVLNEIDETKQRCRFVQKRF